MEGTPEGDGQTADERHRPPKKPRKPPIVRVLRTLKRRYHARKRTAQESKESNERMMARWTRNVGFFTLGLVVVGVFTAGIFGWQLNVMQGQLAAMEADQRPWLSINTIRLTGPLSNDDESPIKGLAKEGFRRWHVNVSYAVNNVGKSPATNVEQQAMLTPFIFPFGEKAPVDFMAKMRSTCEFAEFSEIIGFGREEIVFPGQSTDKIIGSLEGLPDAFKGASANPKYTGKLVATICVTYQAFSSEKTLLTARAFILGKKTGKPFDLRGETVPLDQLDFAPSPIENSFAE